jgi:alanyl-tRNA synthetase
VITSRDLREKYLSYFEKLGHKRISPAPLVLKDDPSTLFTSAGMQPLVPYLKGQTHPDGVRLVDSQPSFRSQDIDEVGDNRHTTFFEMLGNWSLGDYFKNEQLEYIWKFLTEELELPKEKLYVSVFSGEGEIAKDEESKSRWLELGVSEDHIYEYGFRKNWWSLYGPPENMPVGEIGGPDSEVFYDFGTELKLHENSEFKDTECNPNCDCGRFLEIGNSVFIQYMKKEDGSLEELPQKNVDFGGGLERLVAAVNNDPDVYRTDGFLPLINILEKELEVTYGEDVEKDKVLRIVTDHIKASVFLIKSGVVPGNKLQGYVLRRLLRRSAVKLTTVKPGSMGVLGSLVDPLIEIYDGTNYLEPANEKDSIRNIIDEEISKFRQTLDKGLKEVQKIENIDGKQAFDLYQSYGFPLELTEELFREKGQDIDRTQFVEEFEKHRELSRTASAGMFKGGLAGDTPVMRKYHTAAHLLQAALRKVLGEHVEQAGQNITDERLRFDFKHTSPLTDEQKAEVEEMINKNIEESHPVYSKVMDLEEAYKEGALGFFRDRYGKEVSVYTVGDPSGVWVSKEICGGPHVENTNEIGHVTITREESAGAGIRRIYINLQ